MSDSLLSIKDLRVRVEEKEILHGISFDIKPGETHVVMGPNGADKSTLGNAIMGNPSYEVTGGEIFFDGKDLLDMAVNDLKSKGITPVYLVTDHTGFYERYGWEFYGMVQGDHDEEPSRMYIHRGMGRGTLENIIQSHLSRYPLMEPTDVVKLLYQNEFGGGHLISDPARSLAYLRQEWESLSGEKSNQEDMPLLEDIGGGLCRLHLAPAKAGGFYTPEQINDWFVRSAAAHRGSQDRFLATLDWLEEKAEIFPFRFSKEALQTYLAAYREAGCPLVSHSETYRRAYRPAYRVVLQRHPCNSGAGT